MYLIQRYKPPGQNLPVYKNTTVKLITNKPANAVVQGRVKEAELSELELKASLTVARSSSLRVSVDSALEQAREHGCSSIKLKLIELAIELYQEF